MKAQVLAVAVLVATSGPGCRHARSPGRAAPPAAAAVTSARPPGRAGPTPARCQALWDRYHAQAPEDPYTDAHSFVARCTRSDPAVLDCLERARGEIEHIATSTSEFADGGAPDPRLLGMLLRFALPSRMAICTTRERLRSALHSGELQAIARDVATGKLVPDDDGVVVLRGARASLPARGVIEHMDSAEAAPPGEIRVARRADGSVLLYFLGGLLGRHQNQVGFAYSSVPFTGLERGEEGEPAVCFPGRAPDRAPDRSRRYLLGCLTVTDRLAPQLFEVGAAPD